MFRRLARNILANWTGFMVHAVVTFFLTPFVLRELGETRYGVWVLAMSIVGHYGMLDIGLRGGTTFYLTRYLAAKQYDRLNATLSSVFLILTPIGVFIGLLSPVIGRFAPQLFEMPPEIESEVFYCVAIVGASAAIQIALFPFLAVLIATQRFDLANLIAVTTRLATAAAIWLSLSQGHGLLGLTIVTAVGNLAGYLIQWRVAYSLLPELHLSARLANWASSKELLSFGVWNMLIGISIAFSLYTDELIVGLFLPLSAVTVYALAANLARQIGFEHGIMARAREVFSPAAVAAHAEGDTEGLHWLFFQGSRLLLLAMIILAVIGGVWAGDFYELWVGGDELSQESILTVTLVFRILLGAVVLQFVSGTAGYIVMASGRIRLLASLAISESITNLVLNVILIQAVGIVGVAVGTLVATLVFRAMATPWIASRQLSVRLTTFILQTWARPIIVGICLTAVSVTLRRAMPPDTWFNLVVQGLIAAVVAIILYLFIGLRTAERHLFVVKSRDFLREKML